MMRLSLLVLQRDERKVLLALAKLGAVQFVRSSADASAASFAQRDRAAELARCSQLSGRLEELRKALGLPKERQAQAQELTLTQAQEQITEFETQTKPLLARRTEILQRRAKVTDECDLLSDYGHVAVPLADRGEGEFLHFLLGTVPSENLEPFRVELGSDALIVPMTPRDGRCPLIVMFRSEQREDLQRIFRHSRFEPTHLPARQSATTESLFFDRRCERETLSASLAQVETAINALATRLAYPVAELEQALQCERSLLEADQGFWRTESAILLSGWVPAAELAAVKACIDQVTHGRCAIETTGPDTATEEPPVLLSHAGLLRPFTLLVSAYGLPNYHEVEPTVFVALSYLVMFGLMFGDVGHGAVLALLGLALRLKARRPAPRDMGLLLLLAGAASMVAGSIYGSFFGIASFKRYALWHDPLEGEPMALMLVAIVFGVGLLSLGLMLNIVNRFRRHDLLGGMLDKFGLLGLLFYWGALLLFTGVANLQASGLFVPALLLFLGLPILGWSFKEPLEYLRNRRSEKRPATGPGFIMALIESLVGAFEAVLSYLANTISFVRLAAYAMSHAALLMAAFVMAAELKQRSALGGALSVLVIILGNAIAIILEGIIASVQALRLEYYEFFGKFFVGNGRPFEPFRLGSIQT